DAEPIALVERRIDHRAAERYRAATLDRVVSHSRRRMLLARLVFRDAHAQPQAIAHYLERPLLGGMAVDPGVTIVEPVARGSERGGGEAVGEQSIERRAQLVALAGVAQIELAGESGVRGLQAFGGELPARFVLELPENILGMVGGDLR